MPPLPAAQPTLSGIFAAAVTPLTSAGQPDLDAMPALLDFLSGRGCHGVLVLGTTGEGPSFSLAERRDVIRAALRHRDTMNNPLKILAGTGCASLTDTIELTRAAVDLGVDGVVVLPAFFYKAVSAEGLADYFGQILRAAVPADGRLLAYHIPQVSGVGIPPTAVAALRARFPGQFYGMKDSQDDLPHLLGMTQQFPGFQVFAGSDSILTEALQAGAAGGITALANVTAPLNRAVWDAHRAGRPAPAPHAALGRARVAIRALNGPAAMKAALADKFGFPLWPVRAPLQPLTSDQRRALHTALDELLP